MSTRKSFLLGIMVHLVLCACTILYAILIISFSTDEELTLLLTHPSITLKAILALRTALFPLTAPTPGNFIFLVLPGFLQFILNSITWGIGGVILGKITMYKKLKNV